MQWRGNSYLERRGAVQTYEEARERAVALKAKNWKQYLKLAPKHGLPTQPQTLWPDQWEAGGRYAGYLGTAHGDVEDRGLASAMQIRELLGIGHATWKLLSDDLPPDASIAHKAYYDRNRVRDHFAARVDRLKKRDARASLELALDNL